MEATILQQGNMPGTAESLKHTGLSYTDNIAHHIAHGGIWSVPEATLTDTCIATLKATLHSYGLEPTYWPIEGLEIILGAQLILQ